MAKGPYDDIVRKVLERLGANAPKAATKAAKPTAKKATRKAASVPAKPMTKAERSAANRAAWAKEKAKSDAKLAAERPAKKAARTAEAKAAGVKRGNRKSEEKYGYGANQLKTNKAKAFFEREVDKAQRGIDATENVLAKGRDSAKMEAEIRDIKQYMEKEGYKMSPSDVRAIVSENLRGAGLSRERFKRRLKFIVDETKGKPEREIVEMGARRARAEEIKTGKKITGKTPARITKKESELQKRLSLLEERKNFDKVIKKADSKMGTPRGPQKKKPKKIVEQESSKRLRAAQEANAKKNRIDPRVAKMTPAQRKKFLAEEDRRWKATPRRNITYGRGYADAEAKKRLADLAEREVPRSKKGPYPSTDRYGRYSGKR